MKATLTFCRNGLFLIIPIFEFSCGQYTSDQSVSGGSALPARQQCFNVAGGVATMEFEPVVLLAKYVGSSYESFCTGTFVSSTTLITAAHCIGSSVNGDMDVLIDDCSHNQTIRVTATKSFHHGLTASDYKFKETQSTDVDAQKKDLAILIVPDGTVTSFMSLSTVNAKVSDKVDFVGFGRSKSAFTPESQDEVAEGVAEKIKRVGHNDLTSDSMAWAAELGGIGFSINGESDPSSIKDGNGAWISSGDSGGPLLINSNIVGVASTIFRRATTDSTLELSLFVDLFSEESQQLLQKAVDGGAIITGWDHISKSP